jgi:MoaE-MoaD fusion protein
LFHADREMGVRDRPQCGASMPREIAMKIAVLFFGVLKELAGCSGETVELPEGAQVHELLLRYVRKVPRFEAMVPSLAISVNQEYAGPDRPLSDGDEVGLLPPVSGGLRESGNDGPVDQSLVDQSLDGVSIVRERIDAAAAVERLKGSSDGAVAIFDGIVRDNTRGRRTLYLDYEAYEPMALKQMQSLVNEGRSRFGVRAASIVHRLGRLEIGETSVLIVVASAHRAAAFDACRWMIDTLKKTVPIWKKEYFEDGAVWADGEPFPEEIQAPAGTTGRSPAS